MKAVFTFVTNLIHVFDSYSWLCLLRNEVKVEEFRVEDFFAIPETEVDRAVA